MSKAKVMCVRKLTGQCTKTDCEHGRVHESVMMKGHGTTCFEEEVTCPDTGLEKRCEKLSPWRINLFEGLMLEPAADLAVAGPGIEEVMRHLRLAINEELHEASEKHRKTWNENAKLRKQLEDGQKIVDEGGKVLNDLQKTVSEAAEILHNVPRLGDLHGLGYKTQKELEKIDKKIEKAWDLLDKTRAGSTA